MTFRHLFRNSSPEFKKNISLYFIAYFVVLFNYALIRASSTTLFFEAFGAKSSPGAWLWGVGFLSLTVYACNRFQVKHSVQKVFLWASLFSTIIFLIGAIGFSSGISQLAYLPFVWKEIYIVLQVHLLLGYANVFFDKDMFKVLVGPIGAVGSIGSVLGGMFTSALSTIWGTSVVMWVGMILIFAPSILFLFTTRVHREVEERGKSPLSSLTPEIRKYVGLVALMVALSQFIINIADFNFNVEFERAVTGSDLRTSYLGHIYTVTNILTLVLQFIVLPFLLPRESLKRLHLFIPLSYLSGVLLLIGLGLHSAIPVASFFIFLKASDYSLFSAGKELIYQPLTSVQKYGAKYLTDMLVYRFAKALIALVLIYLQSSSILNGMMICFLCLWLAVVVKLFKLHRQLF